MIIDMNSLSNLVAKLNEEFFYKITATKELAGRAEDYDFCTMITNGQHITIKFLGLEVWNSQMVEMYENLKPEEQIAFFESDAFELHIRQLLEDELSALTNITMLK